MTNNGGGMRMREGLQVILIDSIIVRAFYFFQCKFWLMLRFKTFVAESLHGFSKVIIQY